MGASLRALFELPSDYEGRDEADDDDKLVSRYAEINMFNEGKY